MLTEPHGLHAGIHVMNLQNHNPKHLVNASLANKQHKLVNMQDFIDVDGIKFLHASIGGLLLSTVKQAINAGYLQSRPVLTVQSLNKLQELDHTILGYMNHVRKNKISTKVREISEWDLILETLLPNKSRDFFHKSVGIRDAIYADQTSKFTCAYKRGHNCLFVTCPHDVNAILVRTLKREKLKN